MGRKAIDETGNTYGRLVVLKRAKAPLNRTSAFWLCQCECGNRTVVLGAELRRNGTKSCGCLRREFLKNRGLDAGIAAMRARLCEYRRSAKNRNLSFELSEEEFIKFTSQPCYYCGIEPTQIRHKKNSKGSFIYNGLDRVNNNEGYTIQNIVPCCRICNVAKATMTRDEFIAWVHRVAKHNPRYI